VRSQASEAKDGDLINRLHAHRTFKKSHHTQKAAEKAKRELEQMRKGSALEQLCAWYFSEICSGYGYVVRTEDGLRSRHGWVTPKQLLKHLGGCQQPTYLAIRPPSPWTNWAVLDIDEGSRYHPLSEEGEGVEPVLEALEGIGLKVGLEFQSSTTGGMHIWFPIKNAVGTWDLAVAIQHALTDAGLEIKNGILEVRPNKKSFNSQYQAIRAPLTGEGNALFIEDIGLTEELAVLKQEWTKAKEVNQFIPTGECNRNDRCSSNRRGQGNNQGKLIQAQERVETGFTGRGQTNELKLACLQVARLIEGLSSEVEIRERTIEMLTGAPGYQEFCGHKAEIESGRYITRTETLKALCLIPGGYKNTWKERVNKERSRSARERACAALQEAFDEKKRFSNLTEAHQHMRERGAPVKSWWHKRPQSDLLQALKDLTGQPRCINQ